ncbi:MAG: non-canonical purine NTP pyrophosphatase [Candidatus Woesearchaeota archaeon]
MKEILFATGNKAKLGQFQYMADKFAQGVKIISAKEKYGGEASYEEIGNSAQEIAINGAKYLFQKLQVPIITEDSILEINSLNGKPGLKSNAFLKEFGRKGVLDLLKDKNDRFARIISCVVYFDGLNLQVFENVVEGKIALTERFKEGEPIWIGPSFHEFGGGYNSIFMPEGEERTLAEMTAEEGITFGYREKNFKKLLEEIEK